jgi:hypothetical protein
MRRQPQLAPMMVPKRVDPGLLIAHWSKLDRILDTSRAFNRAESVYLNAALPLARAAR